MRTLSTGMSSASATAERTTFGPCVPDQTVAEPFLTSATAQEVPIDPCCVDSLGENYSREIYSGDLKIAGLAKRMHFNPGIARFLLVSATYSTRAYGTEPKRPDRQRNVGMDIGLNLPEILCAVGVPQDTWWGTALYKALNVFRIPFTAFGIRYDMNHKKWHGPDTGQGFD